jgi:hypothetical protein
MKITVYEPSGKNHEIHDVSAYDVMDNALIIKDYLGKIMGYFMLNMIVGFTVSKRK